MYVVYAESGELKRLPKRPLPLPLLQSESWIYNSKTFSYEDMRRLALFLYKRYYQVNKVLIKLKKDVDKIEKTIRVLIKEILQNFFQQNLAVKRQNAKHMIGVVAALVLTLETRLGTFIPLDGCIYQLVFNDIILKYWPTVAKEYQGRLDKEKGKRQRSMKQIPAANVAATIDATTIASSATAIIPSVASSHDVVPSPPLTSASVNSYTHSPFTTFRSGSYPTLPSRTFAPSPPSVAFIDPSASSRSSEAVIT
ncbi:hypothetical protein K501DRAFT_304230 [Backusella circina FSU 941]|nr:hypothetical protein K501DRAFT_304230 [Backusella circina FSU 941]